MVTAAVLLLVVLGAGAAGAKASAVTQQAWTRTGPVPTFVAQADRLYVAADLGTEQARAFVGIDLEVIGTAADTATLTLAEVDAGPLPAALLACPLASALDASGELPTADAPAADCTTPVAVEQDADGGWTVALDALLPRWRAGGQPGLAIVPDIAAATGPFSLAFDPAGTAVALPRRSRPQPARPATSAGGPGAAAGSPMAQPAPAQDRTAPVLDLSAPDPGPQPGAGMAANDGPLAEQLPVAAPPGPAPAAGPATVAQPDSASLPRGAGAPPSGLVVAVVALLALGPAVLLARRDPTIGRTGGPVTSAVPARVVRALLLGGGAAALVGVPPLLGEATVFNLGMVLIFIVGAIGLHLLVNWAGELSLAHATMVGFPAFAVAKLSADAGISPIVLLPVGVVVGAIAGAVVGLPAIRARGLQVALVTLAAGVAIDRFFFTRSWFVGPPAGAQVSVPSLGPLQLGTARSLYPVLAILVVATVGITWMLYRSKLVRALLWIKADPAAAEAFGIPVARYRTLAYVIAGTFAGLAGALTAMWVQRLTPQAFPLSHSFAYLMVVALAGRGFIGGVGAAAAAVEGGRLFLSSGGALLAYGAPIALILTLTRHRDGLNGLGRQLSALVRHHRERTTTMHNDTDRSGIRLPAVLAVLAIVVGFTAIGLAWYHAGNTADIWVQNQELISGGIGGLGLVVLGVGLLLYDAVVAGRAAEGRRLERLLESLAAGRDADPTPALPVLRPAQPDEDLRPHRVAAR